MSGGYVMVPGWLLDLQPTGNHLKIYCILARYGRFDTGTGVYEECRPAVPTICRDTGLSESVVHRGLRWLREQGAIIGTERRNEDGGQAPTVYRVVFGTLAQTPPGVSTDTPPVPAETPPGVSPAAPNPEPTSTQNQKTQKTSKPSASRGTRLPVDFAVTEELRAWFTEQHFGGPADFWRGQHAQFIDYWRGRPGQAGVKVDWPATWRNWMRKAAERLPHATGARPAYQSTDEKRNAARAAEAEIAKIADQLAEARGATGRDPVQNAEIGREARRIYEAQMRAGSDSGYTVATDTIDGTWTEPTRREVTGGPHGDRGDADVHRAA